MRRLAWSLLALAGVLMVTAGLSRGEWISVKRHADTLCTACIGLTAER